MFRFSLSFCFSVLLFGTQAISEKNTTNFELEDALIESYISNPRLMAERQKLFVIDEELSKANANFRPRIRLEGEAAAQKSQWKLPLDPSFANQVTSFNGGSFKHGMYTTTGSLSSRAGKLVAEQPLYRGGRTIAQKKAAFHAILAQRHVLNSVEQDVFIDVIHAHLNVVAAQSILDLQHKTESVLSKHLEATKIRLDVGEVTKTDLSQAEFRLAGAKAERIKAESDLKNARSNYEKIVGFVPNSFHFPKIRPQLPFSLQDCLDIAEKENPLILATREDEISSSHEVRLVKGELLPTLSLRGELTQANNQFIKNARNRNAGVFLNLSIPLYSSGSVEARIRQASHTQSQKGYEIERARRDVREHTEQSWDQWVASKAQIDARKAEVISSEIALDGVINEQKAGARSVLEVLDAEKEALRAKVNLVQAERDEILAAFSLLPAMGRLNVAFLGLKVQPFDSVGHFEEVRSKWFGLSDSKTLKVVG
ncbi:MAG: TolC family outer membrane protein [Alphaproteobacteria bacterium]|nr:TolC family outer membrane protein [Alphaproteobacteria bacterium]